MMGCLEQAWWGCGPAQYCGLPARRELVAEGRECHFPSSVLLAFSALLVRLTETLVI